MHSPVWDLISFTLMCLSIGVLFMTTLEEICSTNKTKLRFYLMVGLLPLILLGTTTSSLFRRYFSMSFGSDWLVVTSIGALAVFAFVLGIGCVACLRTYRERSALSNDQLFFYLLLYLCGGVLAPLLAMASGISNLIHLHSTVPH